MAEVRYHPEFVRQLEDLASKAESDHWLMELFGEVMALLRALEDHGHDIEGYQPMAPTPPGPPSPGQKDTIDRLTNNSSTRTD